MTRMEPPNYVSEYYLARFASKSFVMVEGTTDRALWNEYTDRMLCSLYPTKEDKGKDTIIAALKSTHLRDMLGFAGIVDADYWLITQAPELNTDNLLYDDCCSDMELILLRSDALKKILRNNFYNFDIDEIDCFAETLIRESYRLAAEFGYFRLYNDVNDCGLRCNAIPLAHVIDVETLELEAKLVASKLTGHIPGLTSEDLLQQVAQLREQYPPNNRKLCRGKDVVAIIAHIFPALFEAHFGKDLPPNTSAAFKEMPLSISLRSAYEFGYFKQTSLFKRIQEWEDQNCPYKILKSAL